MSVTDLWQPHDQARWFGGKGRGGRCVAVEPLGWFGDAPSDGGFGVRPEIATLEYPDGSRERYQLLVSYRPAALPSGALGVTDPRWGVAHDVTMDAEALARVVAVIGAGRSAADGSWTTTLTHRWSSDLPVQVYGGEQSNTNVLLGGEVIAKFFRRLETGRNLDVSVHAALNAGGVEAAATLHGWVEATLPDGSVTDLAMIVEQLREASDGWGLAVASCQAGTDFAPHAHALGAALAEVHRALASSFGTQPLDTAAVAEHMRARLAAAVVAAPALAPHREPLQRIIDRLADVPLLGQRIHGDFHLGQTLHTPDGWRIIDFEGEPMKTLAERAAPDSPLRDVAGMLRSFGYATSGADHLPRAHEWQARCLTTFLDGYGDLPEDMAGALAAYEADKAVYEVVYETRNRPDWIDIPMAAVQHLTEGVHP